MKRINLLAIAMVLITVPDIPQESDLLNDKSKMDIEKVMREGF